jgi:rubrerythrin
MVSHKPERGDHFMTTAQSSDPMQPTRRTILGGFSRATLSVGALGLLAACQSTRDTAVASAADPDGDTAILNVALGLEHEAIAAYQLGAETGLLQPEVLAVAVMFQGHHKGHRDALAATIEQLGGTPVGAKPAADYTAALSRYPMGSQAEILVLARTLELQAANAYLGAIPALDDDMLGKVAARIAADETMHWTTLAQVTGEPLPAAALTFGA